MSEWIKTEDEGVTCYINEELGNIVQIGDSNFIALFPQIVRVGPFPTAEAAQEFLAEKKEEIKQYMDAYNEKYLESLHSS